MGENTNVIKEKEPWGYWGRTNENGSGILTIEQVEKALAFAAKAT